MKYYLHKINYFTRKKKKAFCTKKYIYYITFIHLKKEMFLYKKTKNLYTFIHKIFFCTNNFFIYFFKKKKKMHQNI